MQLSHVETIWVQMCQMTKQNKGNQMYVIIVREILDIQLISKTICAYRANANDFKNRNLLHYITSIRSEL